MNWRRGEAARGRGTPASSPRTGSLEQLSTVGFLYRCLEVDGCPFDECDGARHVESMTMTPLSLPGSSTRLSFIHLPNRAISTSWFTRRATGARCAVDGTVAASDRKSTRLNSSH